MEPGLNFGPPSEIRELPTPSGYRQTTPAILDLPPIIAKATLFQRKRVIIGIGIAAALHVVVLLAWWLTPPLRLKAGYSPERWVQVLSLPKSETGNSAAATSTENSKPPVPATRKSRHIKAGAAPPPPAVAPEVN